MNRLLRQETIDASPQALVKALDRAIDVFKAKDKYWSINYNTFVNTVKDWNLQDLIDFVYSLDYEIDSNIPNKEVFRAPWVLLFTEAGDCDDVVLFVASWVNVLKNIYKYKILYRYVFEGIEAIEHVAIDLKIKNKIFRINVFGDKKYKTLYKSNWR